MQHLLSFWWPRELWHLPRPREPSTFVPGAGEGLGDGQKVNKLWVLSFTQYFFLSSPKTSNHLASNTFPIWPSAAHGFWPHHSLVQNCYSLPITRLISTLTLFSSINKATQSPNYLLFFSALLQLSLTLENSFSSSPPPLCSILKNWHPNPDKIDRKSVV